MPEACVVVINDYICFTYITEILVEELYVLGNQPLLAYVPSSDNNCYCSHPHPDHPQRQNYHGDKKPAGKIIKYLASASSNEAP